jgi:hypothetical protein
MILTPATPRINGALQYPSYKHVAGAGTVTVKTGNGALDRIVVNTAAAGTLTIYDNTAGSGTVIAVVTLVAGSPVILPYQLNFFTGLTLVVTGAQDLTVVYM